MTEEVKPRCSSCGNTTFRLVSIEIRDCQYDYNAVVCSSCGAIVPVLEAFRLSYMLHKIAEKLDVELHS
jgi:uncharacterized Zn finger protein